MTAFSGLSHQLSSASTHSLPSRIDQLTDCEDDYEEEDDSSSALDVYDESASNSPVISEVAADAAASVSPAGPKYSRAGQHITTWYVSQSS